MDSSVDDLRRLLASHGIDTVVIGAHAANLYRLEVRHTVDVDLLASSLEGAGDVLRAAGWSVREISDEEGHAYVMSAKAGSAVIDLLLAETDYQRMAMRRAVDGALTVEDVIVHKLIAGRSRDIDDIRSILATGIDVDERYVSENAREWGVLDRWSDLDRDS